MSNTTTKKPDTVCGDLANLPAALAPLCQIDHWVLWKWEWVPDRQRWSKPLYTATRRPLKAKNNDPATWAPYSTAIEALGRSNGDMDGIGFVLLGTQFDVVDLDHCFDPKTSKIDAWAATWLDQANGAYVEVTPSGEGLRIIGSPGSSEKIHRKWLIKGAREDAAIEAYRDAERYITVTGAQIGACAELRPIHLLEKIVAHYDAAKKVDFNTAANAAATADNKPTIDWDDVIQNGAPEGKRSELFQACVWHLAVAGMSTDQITAELGKHINGIGAKYRGRLREEVERSYAKWKETRKIGTSKAGADSAEPEEPESWDETDRHGKPKATRVNTRRAINALNVKCRYDAFHDRMIIEGKIVTRGRTNLDHVALELREKIHRAYKFDPGTQTTLDALISLCLDHTFDPIVDYLNALTWDGTPRLERWLITYCGAADNELNREFGRLALIAAVRRARRPGCKFDPIVVLEGKMGTEKSKAIEILAGSENFSDQSILGVRDREQQELLAGVWLYEIADLANIRRTEVEHIKAFASRTHDRARPAYGRTRLDQPRRCVIFATTNDDTYLKEADRRFWPVKTGKINTSALRHDRNQLWAEAAAQEPGADIVLAPRLWATAGIEQEARREHDPWDDRLATACGTVEQGEERVVSADLLAIVLEIPVSRQRDTDFKRLARCMRRLGWDGPKKTYIGGKDTRGYTRPRKEPK